MQIQRPLSEQPTPPEATKVFSGVIFDVYQWQQKLFNGETATFEKLKRADTVLVIPVTPEGKILMVHDEQPGKAPFVGFAGGEAKPGEAVEETAARELREETGYQAANFSLLEAVQPFSKVDWAVYTLVAHGCVPVSAQELDGGEKISLQEVSFEELVELALREDFHEKSLTMEVLRAKLDPARMARLKKNILGGLDFLA